MKTIHHTIAPFVTLVAVLSLTMTVSCSKEHPVSDDTLSSETAFGEEVPAVPEKPSKYKPEELVTVTFTADAEGTRTSIGEPGSGAGGAGRSITWTLGDRVTFVWGPDEEDRSVGTVTSMSEDGKRATFTVEKVYEGAKAIYAVYPAGTFHSFTKGVDWETDGTGTVRVRVGQMADGTRLDGSFGEADACIGRSSLESGKMKFKHLVAFVTMTATNPAAQGVRLDGGSVSLGGILPVTATVGEDGYTQSASIAPVEDAVTVTTVASAGLNETTYIPVLADLSFADGIAMSYLDGSDGLIGQATLRKNTRVALGSMLTFPSTINNSFSKDYFVTASADGSGDGSSWSSAWTYAQMETYVEDANNYEEGLAAGAPVNIHIAAGTYAPVNTLFPRSKWTDSGKTAYRRLNLIGGYPSAPGATSVSNPAVNETIFSGVNLTQGSGAQNVVKLETPGLYSLYGLVIQGNNSAATGRTALSCSCTTAESTFHMELSRCTIRNNVNTGVGAGSAFNSNGPADLSQLVQDCVFENNEAGGAAGINIDGDANVITFRNCLIKSNHCHNYSNRQNSGAGMKVGRGTVYLENCRFEDNYIDDGVSGNGAALWLSDEGTTLGDNEVRVTGCSFTGNWTNSSVSKGGAVFVQRYKSVVFDGCTFSANECKHSGANSYGGAMVVGVLNNSGQDFPADNIDLTLSGCVFDGNNVAAVSETVKKNGGGAIFLTQADGKTVNLTISGGEIKGHNNDYLYGNGIFAHSGTLTLDGCDIHDNRTACLGSDVGAGLFIKDADCTLSNGTAVRNNLNIGGGAGIFMNGSGGLTMTSGRICDNRSTGAGAGGLRVSSSGVTLNLTGVTISGNRGEGGYAGGVAVYKNTSPVFTGCTFSSNYSSNYAGAVYVSGENGAENTATFTDCIFRENTCSFGGGAICISNAGNKARDAANNEVNTLAATTKYDTCNVTLTVNRCTFEGNYSTVSGAGAVHCQTSGAVRIDNSTFTGNYTSVNDRFNSGGALYLAYGQVSNATGESGDPKVTAGVVNNPKKGDFTLTGCTFTDNHTARNGGGYNLDSGGAIAVGSGTKLSGSVQAANPCLVKIYQCNFIHNSATQGGALASWDAAADTYISNCLFYRNYITRAGGSIIAHYNGGLHINNSTLTEAWGSWNVAYINFHYGCLTLANSSLIGVPKNGENSVAGATDALLRFDGCRTEDQQRTHIINSLICCTQTDRNAITVWQNTDPQAVTLTQTHDADGNATSKARGLMNTLFSGTVSGTTFNHPGQASVKDNYWATTDYFGNLSWTCDTSNPTWENSYWSWNGSYPNNAGAYKSSLVNMNNDLDNSDPNFYDWLVSLGVVSADHNSGKDQRGHDRSTNSWQGAYNN